MRWILALLIMLVIVPAAFGQYAFQITDEQNVEGNCINERDITASVSYALNPDGTKQVFPDHPDGGALDDDDLMEWYIDADADGFYLVSFSFSGVGLSIPKKTKVRQFWFRYAKDGVLFSEWGCKVVMKPGKPSSG